MNDRTQINLEDMDEVCDEIQSTYVYTRFDELLKEAKELNKTPKQGVTCMLLLEGVRGYVIAKYEPSQNRDLLIEELATTIHNYVRAEFKKMGLNLECDVELN